MIYKFLITILILFSFVDIGEANDNSIYSISDNVLRKDNTFKIIFTENIKDLLIDETQIYPYSQNWIYIINKTSGSINYKISVANIKNITQTENFIYVNNLISISKINKLTGNIETKYLFDEIINKIYSYVSINQSIISNGTGVNGINGSNGINGTSLGNFYIYIDGVSTCALDADTLISVCNSDSGTLINSILTNSKTYYIKSGTYNINNTIDLSGYHDIVIKGSGTDTTIFNATFILVDGIFFGENIYNIEIKDMTLIGNNQSQFGIRFNDSINNTRITNINSTTHSYYGIYVRKANNLKISNTKTNNNTGVTEGRGIYVLESDTVLIENCESSFNKRYGIMTHTVNNVNIINCVTKYNMGDRGIYVYDGNNSLIDHAFSESNNFAGLTIEANHGTISNSKSINNTLDGILFRTDSSITTSNVSAYNNDLIGNNRFGIYVNNASNFRVSDNDISHNKDSGIKVDGTLENGIIDSNTLIDNNNSLYGIYLVSGPIGVQIKNNIMQITNKLSGSQAIRIGTSSVKDTYITNNKITNYMVGIYDAGLRTVATNNYGLAPFDFGVRSSVPTDFGQGDTYFNSTTNKKYYYDGSQWFSLVSETFVNDTFFTISNASLKANITLGGTYNITSSSAMVSMLSNLSNAPILTGNVILQVQSNLTGDYTIPNLFYDGYTVTIQGEMETLKTFTSTLSSASVPSTNTYGKICISGGGLGSNVYQGMFAYAGSYIYSIRSHNDTCILQNNVFLLTPTVGTTYIKYPKYKITGNMTLAKDSRLIIKYLNIEGVGTSVIIPAFNMQVGANLEVTESVIKNNGTGLVSIIWMQGQNNVLAQDTNFINEGSNGIRMQFYSKISTVLYHPYNVWLKQQHVSSRGFDNAAKSYVQMIGGYVYNSATPIDAGSIGLNTASMSSGQSYFAFYDSWGIGEATTLNSYIESATEGYINNTLNKRLDDSIVGNLTITGLTGTDSRPVCASTTGVLTIC